jgi:hypothetical protein
MKGAIMRKFIYSLLMATVTLGLSASLASGQERRGEKRELDARAHDVNALADRHGGMRDALHDVSVETGVPERELQRMHDAHPDAGPAGLLIASVMADNTKDRPERFLNQHVNGRGWASIARENNVPLDKINTKLDNLERELNGSLPATGRFRGREYSPQYSPGYNPEGGYRY